MAKRESTFLNMVLTLAVVTLAASFTLATVYNLTKEPIEDAREAKRQAAISQVVPEFDRLESKKFLSYCERDSLEFNYAFKNDELVGVAVGTFTNAGFSGLITAMVGFKPDGTIIDVVHLQHKETPGLGDKIQKNVSNWSDQFRGMDPAIISLKVKKDGGDVDAITAATITARAYCDAIQRAYNTFVQNISIDEGGENNE